MTGVQTCALPIYDTKTKSGEDVEEIEKSAEDYMYRHKLYESLSMRSQTIDIIMNALVEKSQRELMHSRRVSELCELANFVFEHHEEWDGTGYPRGLKGNEISLEARIIALADAYDAMTNQRSYRGAYNLEETIVELEQCSGTQFDPELTRLFVDAIVKGEL